MIHYLIIDEPIHGEGDNMVSHGVEDTRASIKTPKTAPHEHSIHPEQVEVVRRIVYHRLLDDHIRGLLELVLSHIKET